MRKTRYEVWIEPEILQLLEEFYRKLHPDRRVTRSLLVRELICAAVFSAHNVALLEVPKALADQCWPSFDNLLEIMKSK